jgi:hypothetical protein
MKTAMQELIEAVNQHYSNPLRTDIFDTNPYLEKEKEQLQELKDKIESLQYELKEERDY